MAKDRYEISLWDDIFVSENGGIPGHYEEQKIAVIGSDSMTSKCRAIEPKFVQNINGKNTLTFKMFLSYHDDLTGEDYANPFLNLLVNERKVKTKWNGNWYDLIIKNIQESSNGKTIVYTCEDANINELSKTGFELVFDDDLNKTSFTNQGTAQELVTEVLEGTDWVLDSEGSNTVQQFSEEPVFEFMVTEVLDAYNQTKHINENIPQGKTILVYYSQLKEVYSGETDTLYIPKLQFAYANEYKHESNSELLVEADCYCFEDSSTYCKKDENSELIKLYMNATLMTCSSTGISTRYRAKRLVESQRMVIDNLTKKVCSIYTASATADPSGEYAGAVDSGDTIYCYVGTQFNNANYVTNLMANSVSFLSTDGWSGDSSHMIGYTLYPCGSTNSANPDTPYLAIPSDYGTSIAYFNDAMNASAQHFSEGVKRGEKFIVRFKIKKDSSNHPGNYITTSDIGSGKTVVQFIPLVCTYETTSGYKKPATSSRINYMQRDPNSVISTQDGWLETTMICKKSFSGADIYGKKIGFFIWIQSKKIYIEEAQFFKYMEGANNQRINPGDFDIEGIAKTVYTYYNFTKYGSVASADDIDYLYCSQEDWDLNIGGSYLQPVLNDNFSKIRSISIKNSNRFNILQTIAETFQCWIKFVVPHDSETGKLIYVNGHPTKKVQILNEVGVDRGVGFVYGIDLQTISRTVESNSIVTKTIVKGNDNKYAKNGTCLISRSDFNLPKVDYIYNFDYFINHLLLDGGELHRDLYVKVGSDPETESTKPDGYYYWLNKWNTAYESNALLISDYQVTLTENEARLSVYQKTIDAANETIQSYQKQICDAANATNYNSTAVTNYINSHPDDDYIQNRLKGIASQQQLVKQYNTLVTKLQSVVNTYNGYIETLQSSNETLEGYIKAKSVAFYKKYARFIQEGSWIDSKYTDDNLYYLDAVSVAYTSSRPKVSYNISVLRLTGLEEYKFKDFSLGDIAFVQDTEFFGYTYPIINNQKVKTPYKEKVLITEITYNFDDPSKDSFKVQNYKTEFEDLFQRITATTQSLQYSNGSYTKAADIVETDGTINIQTLANSIAVSGNVLNRTSLNQTVISDEQGITVSDLTDPSKIVRITSGGIFISTDGGNTWKNAVRGEGIATQYLTTGSINTNNISIMDGVFTAFRWDEHGITAYQPIYDNNNNLNGYNVGKFVRFDHYGIYGIDENLSGEYSPASESQIWNDASFGMTWQGFFVKNRYGDHYVEVSSTNDIAVVDTSGGSSIDRVKIGKISDGQYGLQLKDSSGNSVMRTDSTGQLWLDNALYVARSSAGYDVAIGALPTSGSPSYAANSAGAGQVINATNKFIVYEDGSVEASSAKITGEIIATSGRIGNMTIGEVENATYRVIIESDAGTIFRPGGDAKTLTAKLYRSTEEVTNGTKTYQWCLDGIAIAAASSSTYVVTYDDFEINQVHTYDCIITYTPPSGG